jgi:hypothetical protein
MSGAVMAGRAEARKELKRERWSSIGRIMARVRRTWAGWNVAKNVRGLEEWEKVRPL